MPRETRSQTPERGARRGGRRPCREALLADARAVMQQYVWDGAVDRAPRWTAPAASASPTTMSAA